MSSITCAVCGKRYFDFQNHTCGKPYECRADDDESRMFYSHHDHLDRVAEEFAEHVFYDWDCPENLDIEVRALGSDEWHKFAITVEPVPSFSSAAYKKQDCVDCGIEFESTDYKPKRCRKCDHAFHVAKYEEWEKENNRS